MRMLQNTGLCHGYSFNTWSDIVGYNPDFVQDWLDSPQTSMYYSLQVTQNTQAKDDISNALDEDYKTLFDFNETEDEYADPAMCVGCAE